MAPNGPILTQLILDTISIEAYFTLQRRIDARGGFLATQRIRRERTHVLQGYLPALPSSNTPGDLLVLPTFSQTTHAAKKQRRLGFPSGSSVQLGDGMQLSNGGVLLGDGSVQLGGGGVLLGGGGVLLGGDGVQLGDGGVQLFTPAAPASVHLTCSSSRALPSPAALGIFVSCQGLASHSSKL
jgi:hypothetical protein